MMTTTTPFANFYLDATEDYVGEQMVDILLRDGILTFDAIQSDDLGYYSASVITIFPTFLEILKKCTISLTLKKGQGYIIQNSRWLHGRTAFQGEREIYRALVNPDKGTSIGERMQLGFNPYR